MPTPCAEMAAGSAIQTVTEGDGVWAGDFARMLVLRTRIVRVVFVWIPVVGRYAILSLISKSSFDFSIG
jgi:hypothetical protein